MKIKICGITRLEDVSKCETSGTNLMGFVNIRKSKRFVTLQEIITIISNMKEKNRAVLVLEPDNPEEVVMKMKKTGIRTVELHSLTYNQIKYLKWIESFQRTPLERNITIIRAIEISPESMDTKNNNKFSISKLKEIENFAKTCDGLLLNNQIKSKDTTFQIPTPIILEAVKIAKNINPNIKILLTGGINPQNINDTKTLENL
ncbi:MAG: phosphoribosylanthranilate isomerase [Methanobacterium sp.]|nr:phosphoribosylanthranilate isomerase [Methanobacterium sp.]